MHGMLGGWYTEESRHATDAAEAQKFAALAEQSFRAAVDLKPSAYNLDRLGYALMRQNRYPEAKALFERALLPQGNDARKTLANLHVRVDQFVEIPAIVAVIVTGAALWLQAPPTSQGFTLMLVAGCLAIVANLVCVWLVFARRNAARSDHWPRFDVLDHRQHAWGAVVLVGVLVALAAGIGGRGAAG
jgi:tetratricopeptide (TPR) repeat protein